jgi:predicted negative regulator of RcsB-dependent stress response
MGLWILAILFFFFPLFGIEPEERKYEQLLAEVEYYLEVKNLSVASMKLQKLETLVMEPDFRFYTLLGDLFVQEHRYLDALVAYTQSLQKKPDQPRVAKFLYQTHLENKEPSKAFDTLRLYLSQNTEDKEARYQSLILAKRLGEEKYYQFAIQRIRKSSKTKESEFLNSLKNLHTQKKWKELFSQGRAGYFEFPENIHFYNYAQLALVHFAKKSKEMEEILLGKAAIFETNKKYDIQLAEYYKESGRHFEALQLYRRAFLHSLKIDKEKYEEDTLILLRSTYFQLGWEKEALEVSELISMIRQKEKLNLEELENRIRITRNREMIVYILFLLTESKDSEKYNKFQRLLKQRDADNWNRDFNGIFPVFVEK